MNTPRLISGWESLHKEMADNYVYHGIMWGDVVWDNLVYENGDHFPYKIPRHINDKWCLIFPDQKKLIQILQQGYV